MIRRVLARIDWLFNRWLPQKGEPVFIAGLVLIAVAWSTFGF